MKAKQTNLLEGPVLSRILVFSLPIFLGMVFQTFYNLACVYTDLKRFDSAAAALETMQQQYPEDYRTYAGLTYLEYRRNHGNPASRFTEYYQMAKSRYDALTGAEDELMVWLAERYEIGDY